MVVSSASSGLVFVNTFAAGVSAAYESCAIAAENALEALATNSDTVYVTFDTVNNGPHGDLATNNYAGTTVSLSQLKSALASHENSAIGAAAVASLDGLSDPSGGAGFQLPTAYAVMLGLAANPGTTEDTVTLNIGYSFVFGQDVTNTLEHELSEGVLGRVGGLGDVTGGDWRPMDLFRFNASGQRDYQDGRDGVTTYFSYDGGSTTSESAGLSFNNRFSGSTKVNSGDIADFTERDVFGTGGVGETNSFSQTDLQILQALGWNPVVPPVASDFNGDGNSDLIFQNDGTFTEWQSTGNNFTPNVYVNSLGTGWSLAGIGDFNGDGKSDLIFQNGGTFTEWQSTGNSFTQNVYVNTVGAGWNLAGVGDFNGDGMSDLIFQNGGTFTEWQSTGNSFTPNVYVNTVGTGWSLAGVGDFNGDGKSDLIFQNSGTFTEWQSTGNSFTPNVYVNTVGAGWTLVGVGDFNGDGKSDLIFQNGGTFTEWQSTGNGFTPNVVVDTLGTGWSVAAVGDFNGDGLSDILFRNTNGTFTEWQSTGTGFIENVVVNSTVGNAWTLEYSPTGASGTPGAPAGLAASTTTLSAAPPGSGEGGLITTDPTIGMLNQQSSLVANPPLLFGGHPS